MRKKLSGLAHIERMRKPGKPSDFGFKSITEMPPGTRVILVCRQSKEYQRKKLRYQRLFHTRAIENEGGIVVDLGAENLSIVANGRDEYFWERAAHLGNEHNAAVVVESISRLVRNKWFRIQKDKNKKNFSQMNSRTRNFKKLKMKTKNSGLMNSNWKKSNELLKEKV